MSRDLLNRTSGILEILTTERMRRLTREQLEIICEKMKELSIRQSEKIEENIVMNKLRTV